MRLLVDPAVVTGALDEVTESDVAAMAVALSEMEDTKVSSREFQLAHWRYHRVLLARCPEGMRKLIESHLTRIDRHQRMYFESPAVVCGLTATDALFLQAIRVRDGAQARSLLEFHLLDTALGMIMSLDADHEFDSLTVTMEGLGIRLGDLARLRAGEPVLIEWDQDIDLPPLATPNLITARVPGAAVR